LKTTTVKEEFRRVERGVLNIQPLVVRSPSHSSSSLKCVEGEAYNEKILFVQMIIQDINIIGTFAIEFLHKSKRHRCAKE
jgi:hypothetical protein